MKLILIAPSGGGKGSVAEFLVRDYGVPHISTGEIFRQNIAAKTPLGLQVEGYLRDGLFVPDDITVNILLDRLNEPDCNNGFVLDGYPRSLNQAKLLEENNIDVDAVIELDVSDELAAYRLKGRWMCSACGHIHNSNWESVDKCKICSGSHLYQRDDDKEDNIKKRLMQYHDMADVVLDFYRKKGKLFSVHVKWDYKPIDNYNAIKKFLVSEGIK